MWLGQHRIVIVWDNEMNALIMAWTRLLLSTFQILPLAYKYTHRAIRSWNLCSWIQSSDNVDQTLLLLFHCVDCCTKGSVPQQLFISRFSSSFNSFSYDQFHVSCAVVNGKTNAASSESDELDDVINSLTDPKELTDSDIERMKKAFESELTPTQMNELTRILQKFKVGTTPKDHFEGMVSVKQFNGSRVSGKWQICGIWSNVYSFF